MHTDTAGYGARIARALERGPRPMSARELARRVGELYPDLRGTSYGGIRQYAEGNIQRPRVDLLRAIADVLGVRAEWLAFDEDEMTEDLQRAREAREAGEEPDPGATWGAEDFLRVVGGELGDGRLLVDHPAEPFLLEGWARLLDAGISPAHSEEATPETTREEGLQGIGRAALGQPRPIEFDPIVIPPDVPRDSRHHYAIAVHVGQMLRVGLAGIFPYARDLGEAELTDYVASTLQALHRVADAARRRAPEFEFPTPSPDEPAEGDSPSTEHDHGT
ncbi:MAG: helix-turn-helix transcriptional regulator [Gemmatimonadota bacterium]